MNYAVKVDGFSYCYPDGTLALCEINLTLEEGQKVALIGPSGAGKSTLLRALAGFIRGSGTIAIDGLELCSQNLRKIRSVLGCFMGNPDDYLTMPTVYEDIIVGPLSSNMELQAVRQNVDFVLGTMGLTTLIKKAPYRLSDGQKRSTAIASILSVSPKIILMDEPCSGLDPYYYHNMVRLFHGLMQTVVFSTSNLRFAAEAADRVIVFDNGQILADGDPSEILNDQKLLTAHHLD